MPDQPRPVWTDGDPLMEAIAAAVWEQCHTEDTSTVRDDPRNIAAVASAVITAEVRAAALNEAADRIDSTDLPQDHVDVFDSGARWATAELRRMAAAAARPDDTTGA